MKNIWNIFRADWRRLTASVVAVVVLLGLCLVPCLYAWFNILSNWDPYGTASTSRISVAVASEDAGCEVLGLEVNIGALVLQGLESNDQMGWVFVDSRAEALELVAPGDFVTYSYAVDELENDCIAGRGLDNRLGAYTVLHALLRAREKGAEIVDRKSVV